MASLLAKDAYLQDLAKKICVQPAPERQRRQWAVRTKGSEAAGPPKKKRKKTLNKSRKQEQKAMEHKTKPLGKKSPTSSSAKKAGISKQGSSGSLGSPEDSRGTAPDSVFALDFLRQRQHEKIQMARGQGGTKELSAATLGKKKKQRRKEREWKKRKRKELRAKQQVTEAEKKEELVKAPPKMACKDLQESGLIFNKVGVTEEEPASKAQSKKEKGQVKGNLTPLTGRNYRQLLDRLHARLGELREDQDADKAQELEAKMTWTNLLYNLLRV